MAEEEWDREITIVLAGKSGAGKSTLMNNLLGRDTIVMMSPDATTPKFTEGEFNCNNIKVHVIDTCGLAEKRSDKIKELKRLSSYTKEKADILLYCVPVGPGSKFDDANPVTMRCLTEAYGKQIWDHCVLVFTMSDTALVQHKKQNSDTTSAHDDYITFLNRYAENFREQLRRLEVNKEVKTLYNMNRESKSNTIIAIPVGWSLKDEVLPGIDQLLSELYPELNKQSKPSWGDILFAIITDTSPAKFHESILKYRYGEELAHKIIVRAGAGLGGVGGGALGALVGGLLGILGGPAGVIAGMGVGIVAGASVIGTAGGTAAGYTVTKLSEQVQKKKTAREVKRIQENETSTNV